eukprot:scaffold24564_cov30-Tisochrysis_lutea.AAC.5
MASSNATSTSGILARSEGPAHVRASAILRDRRGKSSWALTVSKCLCIRQAVRYDARFSSRKKAPKSPPWMAATTRRAICMQGSLNTSAGRLASLPKRTSGSADETR